MTQGLTTPQFFIDTDNLKPALALVARAIPNRATHPVLACVKVDVTDTVKFTAYNLTTGIEVTAEADEIITQGSFVVAYWVLSEIVTKCPSGLLKFTLDDNGNLNLVTSTGVYDIRTANLEDYPELPTVSGDYQSYRLDSIELKESLNAVLFSASTDDLKQILTGVNLQNQGDFLNFATTDGHRLAKASYEDYQTINLTIPGELAKNIIKVCQPEEEIKLNVTSSLIEVEADSVRIITRKLEGDYPNYGQLIPDKFDSLVTVNRKDLVQSLDRISVLPKNVIKFEFTEAFLKLSVESFDIGSGTETLTTTLTGNVITVAFNPIYVKQALMHLNEHDEVQFKLGTSTTPVIITPVASDSNVLYMVMPCRIKD